MRPRLVHDWPDILKRAWSIRLMLLAGLFSGLEVALPFLDGLLPIAPGVFAALSGLTTMAAFITRFLVQNNLSGSSE